MTEVKLNKIAYIESDSLDPKDVSMPTHLDGTPVDKEEAARVHAGLISGDIGIEVAPEAVAEMAELGLTVETFREMLIAATKKTMS